MKHFQFNNILRLTRYWIEAILAKWIPDDSRLIFKRGAFRMINFHHGTVVSEASGARTPLSTTFLLGRRYSAYVCRDMHDTINDIVSCCLHRYSA